MKHAWLFFIVLSTAVLVVGVMIAICSAAPHSKAPKNEYGTDEFYTRGGLHCVIAWHRDKIAVSCVHAVPNMRRPAGKNV